jgi:hypothetical protein
MIKHGMKTVTRNEEFVNSTCDNCEKELHYVERTITSGFQYTGALHMTLHGGWGMYHDHMTCHWPIEGVFCKECADKLVEAFPVFKKILEGENHEVDTSWFDTII